MAAASPSPIVLQVVLSLWVGCPCRGRRRWARISPRLMIAGEFDNPSPPYYNSPMNTPFPGMDPYLEHPTLWADVHDRLLATIADELVPLVAPTYYVALQRHAYLLLTGGERTYLGKPDVAVGMPKLPVGAWSPVPVASGAGVLEVEVPMEEEVDENYLEVREVKTGKLITVIELLSPVNKIHPEGRAEYIEKRNQILRTRTNLVEIDLLRSGQPMMVFGAESTTDYRILVSPGWRRPRAQLYAFTVREPIPAFPLPLLPKDEQPLVQLNTILHNLYQRARFDLRLDYTVLPTPPLAPDDARWAQALLAA